MTDLRDEVYLRDAGIIIQSTWGLIVHYAWEYSGELRIFTDYTEDDIWNELKEVGIEKVTEDEYLDYVEENGEYDIEYWVVNEEDKIMQLSHRQYSDYKRGNVR